MVTAPAFVVWRMVLRLLGATFGSRAPHAPARDGAGDRTGSLLHDVLQEHFVDLVAGGVQIFFIERRA